VKLSVADVKLGNALAEAFSSAVKNPGGEVKVTVKTPVDFVTSIDVIKRTIDSVNVGPEAGQVEAHATVELQNGGCISVRLQR